MRAAWRETRGPGLGAGDQAPDLPRPAPRRGELGPAAEALLEQMAREPDYKEGVKAWMEKRPPAWTG